MRFCFGTFATTLYLCRADKVTKIKLVNVLCNSVDSSCKLPSNAITALLKCTANLPDGRSNALGNVVSKSQTVDASKLTEYFRKKVVPLIDISKRKLAVLALCKIIHEDTTIHDDTVIDIVNSTTKKALQEQSQFSLSHFLAGLFLFATQVDNRLGNDDIHILTDEFIGAFTKLQDTISFVVPHDTITDNNENAWDTYLASVKERFSKLRNLFYKDTPKEFYSFYVPNNIRCYGYKTDETIVTDATAEKLTAIGNFLILDGVGGLGKSMMLRHLLLNAVGTYENFRHIPVFIPIKDYSESITFIDFILTKVKIHDINMSEELLLARLKSGLMLLLFDGLDEIDGEKSLKFQQEIEAFVDQYPKNKYVISSRPYHSTLAFSRFTVLNLMPFTQKQALELIDKLEFRPEDPGFKQKFHRQLQGSLFETHCTFVENPLLLTILLMTFENFADIPTKMHIFYKKAFYTLSEAHDATKSSYKRVFKTKMTPETLFDYFAEFCFRTYKDGKYEFTAEEFRWYFDSLRVNNKTTTTSKFATDLCNNLCLMYQEGMKYHFIHRSFQEYFFALFSRNKTTK